MEPFIKLNGIVAPLDRVNVDTDQIMPKQFLKTIERTGLGKFLFFDWRYLEDGGLNPDFELNAPRYQGAAILVTGRNFGIGSSREHAPWGLLDYGFRAIIAPSFAGIFFNNLFQNGMLPITLEEDLVNQIIAKAKAQPGCRLTVDLEQRRLFDEDGFSTDFAVDEFRRYCLLNGLDDIGLTLKHEDKIRAFEQRRSRRW